MGTREKKSGVLVRAGGRSPLEGWYGVLAGEPCEIFARLQCEDRLDLFPRCSHRVRERALLLDPLRVQELCMARIALQAPRVQDRPPVQWLLRQVDEAIDHALEQDRRVEDSGVRPDEDGRNYLFVSENLLVHPLIAHSACVSFNELDDRTRETFFVLFGGKNIDQCSEMGYGTREEIGEAMRRSLFALKYLDPTIEFDSMGEHLL